MDRRGLIKETDASSADERQAHSREAAFTKIHSRFGRHMESEAAKKLSLRLHRSQQMVQVVRLKGSGDLQVGYGSLFTLKGNFNLT